MEDSVRKRGAAAKPPHQEDHDDQIDDIVMETDGETTHGDARTPELAQKKLREKLRRCEEERKAERDEMQRIKADFLNSRRRLEEQLTRDRERITEAHISALLPLADSFDMAMGDPSWSACDQKWQKGIEAIHTQLLRTLSDAGAAAIGAVGEDFDPSRHEAVANEPVEDAAADNTVVRVLQKGYEMNGAVLRPAKVVVGAAA